MAFHLNRRLLCYDSYSIDDTAHQRMELLIQQIQEQQGVNEKLKSRDQMGWVGACNNIRNAAEEIVLNELIYC